MLFAALMVLIGMVLGAAIAAVVVLWIDSGIGPMF